MKIFFKRLPIFYFFIQSAVLIGQGVPTELLGVWKYEVEGLEGLTIISPTHSAWIIIKDNRQTPVGGVLSVVEKVKAFDAIHNIAISTLRIDQKKRCSTTYIYHYNPSNVNQSFSWDYEVNGDFLTYWIIQSDGARGHEGKYRKLASWSAKTEWSKLNGLWKFSSPNTGYYMHSGNYGLWLIINDPNLQVTTDEGKAHAFGVINSAVVLGQNVDNKHQVWRVLHAFEENMENQSIYTGMKALTPDLYDVWYDDGYGKPTGTKWQIQRVKNNLSFGETTKNR